MRVGMQERGRCACMHLEFVEGGCWSGGKEVAMGTFGKLY